MKYVARRRCPSPGTRITRAPHGINYSYTYTTAEIQVSIVYIHQENKANETSDVYSNSSGICNPRINTIVFPLTATSPIFSLKLNTLPPSIWNTLNRFSSLSP